MALTSASNTKTQRALVGIVQNLGSTSVTSESEWRLNQKDFVLLGADSVSQIFPDDPSNVSGVAERCNLIHLPQSARAKDDAL